MARKYKTWDYLLKNPGNYKLKDSNELYFVSKDGKIHLMVPDEQRLELASEVWHFSKFIEVK
jgi:hypothetical protein